MDTLSALTGRQARGDVAKWFKAGDCKSPIRGFESRRRLQISSLFVYCLNHADDVAFWVDEATNLDAKAGHLFRGAH